MPTGRVQHTPLPPSVEKAYYRKCIELKKRVNEVEENNDAARLRKIRLDRTILKLRLERAFLLEQLASRMEHNVDESDRSTSPPPTPQDKPLRSKRSHRKTTPPTVQSQPSQPAPEGSAAGSSSSQPLLHPLPHQLSSAHSTPDPNRTSSGLFFSGSAVSPMGPLNGTPSLPPLASMTTPQSHGLPPPPSLENPMLTENAAHENGTPGEPARDTSGEANGDRGREDTEMADASPTQPQQPPANSGGSLGGFTAVNR